MFCLQKKYRTHKYSNILHACIFFSEYRMGKIRASVTTPIAFYSRLLTRLVSRILLPEGSSRFYGRLAFMC